MRASSSRGDASVLTLGGGEEWRQALERELGEPVALPDELGALTDAKIAIVAGWPELPLGVFPRLELAVSLLAGVDALLEPPPPPGLAIARAEDPELDRRMVESVLLHVLSAHRQLISYRAAQRQHRWLELPQPAAAERPVGFLGFGTLGRSAARAVAELGFPVRGWSRTARQLDGIECTSGPEALLELLGWSEIVVCLLPLTAETRGLLDAERLAAMRRGATLVNLGRGGIVDEEALVEQLDNGHLGGAILDVFALEPLPRSSPLWDHLRIAIYPHAAGDAVPASGAAAAAAAVARHRAGLPPAHPVSVSRGY